MRTPSYIYFLNSCHNSEFASCFLQIFPVVPDNLAKVTMDTWCKEMVAELVTMERESSPHVTTTAL